VIVLAESNFVLELALRQEQFEYAERILTLAEEEHLRLRVGDKIAVEIVRSDKPDQHASHPCDKRC
jgi:hypothetical protein